MKSCSPSKDQEADPQIKTRKNDFDIVIELYIYIHIIITYIHKYTYSVATCSNHVARFFSYWRPCVSAWPIMACCGERVLQNHVARYDSQSTALPWWGWSSDGPTKMTTNWLTWPSTRRGQTIERPQATRVSFSAVVLISPLLKTDQNSSFKVRRQMLTLCRLEPQTPKRWEALYYLILGRFTALFWIILVKTALAHSVTIPSSRCPFESFKDLPF